MDKYKRLFTIKILFVPCSHQDYLSVTEEISAQTVCPSLEGKRLLILISSSTTSQGFSLEIIKAKSWKRGCNFVSRPLMLQDYRSVSAARLAQLGEREAVSSNPGGTNTQGLKITEEKALSL